MNNFRSTLERLDESIKIYKSLNSDMRGLDTFRACVYRFECALIEYAEQYPELYLNVHAHETYCQDGDLFVCWEAPNASILMSYYGSMYINMDLYTYFHEDSDKRHERTIHINSLEHDWITHEIIDMCFSPVIYHERQDPTIIKTWGWTNLDKEVTAK